MRFQRVSYQDREMMESLYRVRYQVYCLERGFRNPADYPRKLECDEYDSFSHHYAALTDTGTVVGTVRIIVNSPLGLPLEQHCDLDFSCTGDDRSRIAEISRLAVLREWRSASVTLGLCRVIYQESRRMGVVSWYAAMDKGLQRLLQRYLLSFKLIRDSIDYFGPVSLYRGDIHAMAAAVASSRPDLYCYLSSAA